MVAHRRMGTPEALSDLPPSAKLVYKVLEYRGPMTQQAIAEETMLSSRTVRYAKNRLLEVDAITKEIYFADARQRLYGLPQGATDSAAVAEGEAR